MSEWKTYKLDELGEILNSKRVPLNSRERENKKGIFPYYGASGIVDYIDEYIFEGEHVLISEDGENLRSRQTPIAFKANGKFWVNNHAHIFKGKEEWINDFVVYYFQNSDLSPYITGAAQPKLNKENLLRISIKFQDEDCAKEIASILSSLDDKIELNLQMNQTLETMAQAIFKEWFVNFNFPGFDGELVDGLPKGWRKEPIDKSIEFLNGLALQKFPPENENEFIPVIKIRELRQGITNASDKASLNIPEQYIINDGDILFSWSGSLEVVIWCDGAGALNQHLFKVSSSVFPKWFYFYWTKYFLPIYQSIAEGKATTMGHIQRRHLTETIINIPNAELMKIADGILASLLDKIIENKIQIKLLTLIRDSLLPKLMTGKIEVKA